MNLNGESKAQELAEKINAAKKNGVDEVYITYRGNKRPSVDFLSRFGEHEIEGGIVEFNYRKSSFKRMDPGDIISIQPIGKSIL